MASPPTALPLGPAKAYSAQIACTQLFFMAEEKFNFPSAEVLFYNLLSASLLSLGNTQVNLVLLSLNRKLLF